MIRSDVNFGGSLSIGWLNFPLMLSDCSPCGRLSIGLLKAEILDGVPMLRCVREEGSSSRGLLNPPAITNTVSDVGRFSREVSALVRERWVTLLGMGSRSTFDVACELISRWVRL